MDTVYFVFSGAFDSVPQDPHREAVEEWAEWADQQGGLKLSEWGIDHSTRPRVGYW